MAITRFVRYRIRHEADGTVAAAVEEFVTAVRQNEPETRYEAWRLEDPLEFLHLMQFRDTEAEERHRSAPYTRRFVEILYPACEEEPLFRQLFEVEQ